MNSCLYKADVMHHRLAPKQHRFHYSVFLFYLDLAEIDGLTGRTEGLAKQNEGLSGRTEGLAKQIDGLTGRTDGGPRRLRLMSRNRFNLFNFRDKDHLQGPKENPDTTRDVRGHLKDYLSTQGIEIGTGRIMVLTNLCTLGYQFNPVSFYFCYDETGSPRCSVVEVCNTFHEMKPYFLGPEDLSGESFSRRTTKYFYISPFADHDTDFDFDLRIPGDQLQLRIDDYDREGKRFFISTLTGKRKALTDARLLGYALRFPQITLQVIWLIHWQALRLWIKKLPFHKKTAFPELQQEVYRSYKT
jgi:DUF1365 family protein